MDDPNEKRRVEVLTICTTSNRGVDSFLNPGGGLAVV